MIMRGRRCVPRDPYGGWRILSAIIGAVLCFACSCSNVRQGNRGRIPGSVKHKILRVLKSEPGMGQEMVLKELGEYDDIWAVRVLCDALFNPVGEHGGSCQWTGDPTSRVSLRAIGRSAPELIFQAASERYVSHPWLLGFALADADDETVRKLIRLLQDDDVLMQVFALNALGWTHSEQAVEALMLSLAESGFGVGTSSYAVESLARLGDVRAVEMLNRCATESPSWGERKTAAQGLGNIGGIIAVEFLVGLQRTETNEFILATVQEALQAAKQQDHGEVGGKGASKSGRM